MKTKKNQSALNILAKNGFTKSTLVSRLKVSADADKVRAKTYHRAIILENVLDGFELEPVYNVGVTNYDIAKDAGLLSLCVDATGQVYHWNVGKTHGFEFALKGKNALKNLTGDKRKMILTKIENFDSAVRRATECAQIKYLPFEFELKVCSLKTMELLRVLHDSNFDYCLGSSCMFSQNIAENISERAIKFYRRSGIRLLVIKQANTIVSRAFVDSEGKYTRLYSLGRTSDNKLKAFLKSNGFTESQAYSGEGYALKTRDGDEIYAPYLDGNYKSIDILDDDITATNGKEFVKFSFNGSQIALKTTNGKVSLNGCTCCECGSSIAEDETNYLASGSPICQDCSSYCEECEETVLADDITTFFYRSRNGDINEGYCCEYCADNMRQVAFRN